MNRQQLLEAIRLANEQLAALGERQATWTDADNTAWDEAEARLAQLETELATLDAETRAAGIAARLANMRTAVPPGRNPAPVPARRNYPTPHNVGRMRAFANDDQGRSDAYDCGLWIRSTFHHDARSRDILEARGPAWLKEHRTQTEGVNTAGGFTVPDPLGTAIWAMWELVGVAAALCDNRPMASDTQKESKDITGQTVYYPGEAGAFTASDVGFGQATLTAVKRATLTYVSSELFEDSVIAIADRVAGRAGHALAYQQDNEFINGDGTATYGGEIGLVAANAPVTGGQATGAGNLFSELTLANFNQTMGKLPSRYWVDSDMAWIMRREHFTTSAQALFYAAGGNTVANLEGGTRAMICGYPVYFTSHMPAEANSAVAAFFGNFRASVMLGQRRAINLQVSEHYAFNQDLTAIRTTTRYDLNVHEAAGPSGATAAGGYVAMLLASS